MDALCTLEVDAGIARIHLDSPSNANALSPGLVAQLDAHLAAAESDPQVRVVVLGARGRVFCSGIDLKATASGESVGGVALPDLLERILELETPVVAAVDGAVRGGGIGLVAAADLAFASSNAHFAFSEVRVGVTPAMIAVVCARRMGSRPLSQFMLTGAVFGPEEAVASGLVTLAVADGLDAAIAECAGAFAKCEPGAIATTKRLLSMLPGSTLDADFDHMRLVSEKAFSTPAALEGMRAFAERRPPPWAS